MKLDFNINNLLEEIPQIKLIKSEELREKIVKAWELAYCNSNFESLSEARFNKFNDYVTLCQHTRSVTEASIQIAKVLSKEYPYEIDYDALICIASLHDISKLLENEPDGNGGVQQTEIGRCYQHSFYSAHYCVEVGMPHKITSAIFAHTHNTKTIPTNIEGIIVTYADLADADAHRFALGRTLHINKLHS